MKFGPPFLKFLRRYLQVCPWGFFQEELESDLCRPAVSLVLCDVALPCIRSISVSCAVLASLRAVPRALECGDTGRSEARLILPVNLALGQTVCIVRLVLAMVVCCADAY